MKIIVTTSNNYHHLLKIFIYLFNKNWSIDQEVEVVGYKKPEFELPVNFTFYSMGEQTDTNKDFSNDLRKYFEKQDDWFIWLFEDSFIKQVDFNGLSVLKLLTSIPGVGRINLSNETIKQDHFESIHVVKYNQIYENTQSARYRLSTQPSIWNKRFLLQYLKPNLSPWEFETQPSTNDGWRILGLDHAVIKHNEGVTKHDIYKYNIDGIHEDQISEMKKLQIL